MDIDGEHMDEHIKEMIKYFQDANQGEADIEGIDFQRVSLTDEQIKKHKIPTKTIERTRNNKKRLADYQRRHGHRQAAELDAFLAVDNGLPFKKWCLML
jgi:DNA mismatch repair ATPase MutS